MLKTIQHKLEMRDKAAQKWRKMDNHISMRQEIFAYASAKYGTKPEYLWKDSPNCAVLRHSGNNKWYGLIMDVPKSRLGLPENNNNASFANSSIGEAIVDILNIKCDPDLNGSLRTQDGFLPAYHMHKGHWISILLDGTVEKERIFPLLDMSFVLTDTRKKNKQRL